MTNPIICALDTTDVAKATALAGELSGNVGAVKLGLEFFTANGAAGVKEVTKGGAPLFLDLKFHDIPNTVAGAVRATAGINAFMMTVHAAGGKAMLEAANNAAWEVAQKTAKPKPLIVAVTVLTSLDEDDLVSIGVKNSMKDQVRKLADLAQSSGLDGIVCSPFEIALLRKHIGPEFKLVVPGIRPEGSAAGDQKRVMTPKEALKLGADYLVIGRPITGASSPKNAAQEIVSQLAA